MSVDGFRPVHCLLAVERSDGTRLEEFLLLPGGDPWRAAVEMLDRFNATLREGESPRVIRSLEAADAAAGAITRRHRWEKTNLVTIRNRRGECYDTARCVDCGATGKRFGLGGGVRVDRAKPCKGDPGEREPPPFPTRAVRVRVKR